GDIVQTVGFANIFDKGSSFYEVIEKTIKEADGYSLIDLENGLQAKMLIVDKINPRAFGALGDRVNDDTQALKRAINFAESLKDDDTLERFEKGVTISLPNGTYKITDTL